jgi:hypothetical protein
MAHKIREAGGTGFNIHFETVEMLKLEKLMRSIEGIGIEYFTSEELEWASNALRLFAPELPSGGYEI